MPEFLNVVYGAVIWFMVPAILFIMLLFSAITAFSNSDEDHRISGIAGFFAGFIVLAVYVVSAVPRLDAVAPQVNDPLAFNPIALGVGFLIGFGILWFIRLLVPSRLIGLLCLILSSASTSALYSYFFGTGLRGTILYLTIAALFGILLHLVFFPTSIREIWNG